MAKNLMPCTWDSLFTGYSAFETTDIEEHEPVIWASLLENEVLYEKNPFIKDKFLSERPTTSEIGENCPGRIGRWIGWRIVQKYAQQFPEITLPELMQQRDAQKFFNESKYKPIPYSILNNYSSPKSQTWRTSSSFRNASFARRIAFC